MIDIFGPGSQRVLGFIAQILDLGPDDVDAVAGAWRRTPPEARAAAWAAIQRSMSPADRSLIRNAAMVAREQAITAALTHGRHDWAFCAAAWDAAGALAAEHRIKGESYRVLVAPMAVVFGWLIPEAAGPVPAQRELARLGTESTG
jgi:hypothetical protein